MKGERTNRQRETRVQTSVSDRTGRAGKKDRERDMDSERKRDMGE